MSFYKKALIAWATLFMLVFSSCGGVTDQIYFYSVDVDNTTDTMITVRYDWAVIWFSYEWVEKEIIAPGSSRIIEWSSANAFSEQVEVEYLGKKKRYNVSQMCTVLVAVQDF